MAYASYAKWYVAQLKAKPFLVNVSSGFLLMSTGDVLAQRVEVRGNDRTQHEHETAQAPEPTTTTVAVEPSSSTSPASILLEATDRVYRTIQEEMATFGWDKSRTAKMAAWSIVFTPFYVGIFKLYDRYLPKKNLPSIAARVGCSFLSSIPINFAFYTYGTAVEHTMEWYEERKKKRALLLLVEQQHQNHPHNHQTAHNQEPKFHGHDSVVDVPYRLDRLVEKTRRKLQAEFVTTIKTSAQFWIPLNFLSFSIIPSHIQPLNLMFLNVFWNCYLSLSQHREVVLESDADKDDNDETTESHLVCAGNLQE